LTFSRDALSWTVRFVRLGLGALLLGIGVAVPNLWGWTAADWTAGFVYTCGAVALFTTAAVGMDLGIHLTWGEPAE
jgi:hypothetical protein